MITTGLTGVLKGAAIAFGLTAGAAVTVAVVGGIAIAVVALAGNEAFKDGYFDGRNWRNGEFVPWKNGNWWYCPPDELDGVFYAASDSRFFDGRPPREINQQDRFEHCLCMAMDASYTATGNPSRRAATMCPSAEEKQAQECLRNPLGPNDAPRECVSRLHPANLDTTVLMSLICRNKLCPAQQVGTLINGETCGCTSLQTPVHGDPLAEACLRQGWNKLCEDGGTNCFCGIMNYGDLPYNDPGCRFDPKAFPGSLERIITPTPDKLFVLGDPRTPDQAFLAMVDRSTTQSPPVSTILPPLRRQNTPSVGTGLTTKIFTTKSVTSGQFQLYLHNADNNVFHEYIDQCELQTLTPGQPATCDLVPDNSTRRGKWNDCLRSGGCSLEFTTQGMPASYNGVFAYSSPTFIGTPTPTSGQVPLECQRPDPDEFRRTYDPFWTDLGGTPQNPHVDVQLGTGATTPVPPTTFTIDPKYIRFINPG